MNETASQPHVFLCAHRHPDMLTLSNFAPHPMLSAKFHLRRNCGKAEEDYSALSNSFTSSPSQLMQRILKCVNRTGTDLLALLCQGMGALRSLLPQPAPPGATTPVSMAPARGLSPPPCRAVSEHPSPSSSDPDPLLWADIPSPSWGRWQMFLRSQCSGSPSPRRATHSTSEQLLQHFTPTGQTEDFLTKFRRSCKASCIICLALTSPWYRSSLQLLRI